MASPYPETTLEKDDGYECGYEDLEEDGLFSVYGVLILGWNLGFGIREEMLVVVC